MSFDSPNPATNITELDQSLPAAGDSRTEGDDHIRSIKNAIKGSFSNFTGSSVTATEAELNYLDGSVAGTGVASKAVVLNGSNAVSTGGAITCTTLTTTSTITSGANIIGQHFLPSTNNTYDLGAVTTNEFRNLYIAGSIKSGDIDLLAGVTVNEFSSDTTMAGNSDTAVPTEKAVKTYADNKIKIGGTAYGITAFNSSEYSLSATSQTIAHGLGAVPHVINVVAVCKVTDAGYAVNDRVMINPGPMDFDESSGASTSGFAISCDATNVYVRTYGTPYFINKTTGAGTSITASSWRLIVHALRYV